MNANTYTEAYALGITEGRAYANKYGTSDAAGVLANIKSTIKGFAASTDVGQMLRGERDFWINQIKSANA